MNTRHWTITDIPDLSGKVILVTGGNSGLGYESVKAFAEKGADVILACRKIAKGEEAKYSALQANPNAKITVLELDLMDLSSIKSFAQLVNQNYSRLDVLLNNAGIMTTPYALTKDGFESQLGTNHLGHYALVGLLLELLKATPQSRVVNVSSSAHKAGKMDFDNLLYENGSGYTPLKAYGRSKLANLLFTYELQRLFESNKVDVISVASHPGGARTNLDRHINGKFWFKLLYPVFRLVTQEQEMGALTQIRASVDPEVKGAEYYGPHKGMKGFPVSVQSNALSHSKDDARKLWEESEKLTGVYYAF